MGWDDEGRKVGWGEEDRRKVDEPPPEHAGPIWMNPKFIIPALVIAAVAIVIGSIVIREDPADPADPGQSASTPTVVGGSTSTSQAVTTTTAAPASPVVVTSTTLPDPLVGIPQEFVDFGVASGLAPDEIATKYNVGMIPYDGPWYPTPADNPPDDHGPGIDRYGFFTIDPTDLNFGEVGATPELHTAVYFLLSVPDWSGGPPGSGTQLGVGIACGDEQPERAGLDGFGGDGWSTLQFFGGEGYSAFSVESGSFEPVDTGFGYQSGRLVVIGFPTDPDCPTRAIGNFFRFTEGSTPSAADPAEYQFVNSLIVSFDPWD